MKITEIETIRLCSHIRTPLKMAYGTVSEIEPVFVCIHTDTGLFGWGEANTIPFVTGETPETILAVLDMLRPMLLGEDPLCIPRIHSIMDSVIDGNPSVKCSIDLALHDLYGQAMGVPLYKLLGGDSDRYWVDVALGIDTPEEMAKSALRYKEEGIRIFKVKAGRDVATDVEAVRCIREACGDDVDIRVDANQGWKDKVYALEMVEWLHEQGIVLVSRSGIRTAGSCMGRIRSGGDPCKSWRYDNHCGRGGEVSAQRCNVGKDPRSRYVQHQTDEGRRT